MVRTNAASTVAWSIAPLLALSACSDNLFSPAAPAPAEVPAEAVAPTEMSAVDLLTRASLDLRGARPTVAEIERVEADPTAIDAMIDAFMDDPRFGARVRDLFSEIYLTRQDYFYVSAADYGLSDEPGFASAVGNEGLHMLSEIAEQDLPYSEIVLADWTMANELLGAAWPVDYATAYGADATGWKVTRYTDGRPAAGLLATNGMWWRYMTNTSNANRGRANAVSRILLCSDYLSRPIEFDRNVNLLDQGAVNDALQTNAGCAACHNTLDPLASYFWGFYYVFYDSKVDTTEYHADREYTWSSVTGVAPGYYGLPGSSLADLGRHIADDPRLYSCMTEQVFSLLNRRDIVLEDTGSLLAHGADFAAGDYTLRSLFRSVMAGPEYRSASSDDPRMTSSKMVSAGLVASRSRT